MSFETGDGDGLEGPWRPWGRPWNRGRWHGRRWWGGGYPYVPVVTQPCVCPQVKDPVLGVDGEVYDNECVARCYGVPVSRRLVMTTETLRGLRVDQRALDGAAMRGFEQALCYRWSDITAANGGRGASELPPDAIVRIERVGDNLVVYRSSGVSTQVPAAGVTLPAPISCSGPTPSAGYGSSTGLAIAGVAAALGLYFVMQSSPGGFRGLSGYHRRGRRRRRRR